MKTVILLVVLLVANEAISQGLGFNEQLNDEWNAYKLQYGKKYDALSEIARRLIWEENLRYIQQHNLEYDLGKHTYYLGINEFADMTHEEFIAKYLGLNIVGQNVTESLYLPPENIPTLPKEVDWRKQGWVTPVKNQGNCGSCWAFSATGALEGQYFRKTRRLRSLSEQQLVDCSRKYGNFGCNGGNLPGAFDYVKKFGIQSENSYRYKAKDGACRYNAKEVITHCSGYTTIKRGSEGDLARAVAHEGPVTVGIDVSHPSFNNYKGGVYYEPRCSKDKLNHAVLVVGYGVERGQNYWLVKNSWGTGFGVRGYIKMAKDRDNNCGIASTAIFPRI